MTKPANKEYDRLKSYYDVLLRTVKEQNIRVFLKDIMKLLNNYKAENMKYRERIKTLKEVLRMMKDIR